MDNNKKVVVLTVHGRRQTVPVTPSTTILQVLETVCKKHEFESDGFGLKHHNKALDVSQMFRFSGLPNNCTLEMFELESKRTLQNVELCVQLETGERFQETVPPSIVLIDALKKLCPQQLSSMKNPVIVYMRTEFYGRDLEDKTLKDIGINQGRSLFRLLDKNPEDLKTQANVYVPLKQTEKPKEEESRSVSKSNKGVSGGFALTKDLIQSIKKKDDIEIEEVDRPPSPDFHPQPSTSKGSSSQEPKSKKYDWGESTGQSISGKVEQKKEEPEEVESEDIELEDDPQIVPIGERNALLFSLDSSQKFIEDLPDSFFDLSVHDLKLVLRDLNKIKNGSAEDPLLTARMREAALERERTEAIQHYKTTIMRIQFPDRLVLQGKFKSTEKVSDIYDFVRNFLGEDFKFHLFTIPPKVIPGPELTLYEARFVPKAVVHFGLEEESKTPGQDRVYLKKEFLDKLSTFDGAGRAAAAVAKMKTKSTGAIPKRPRS
ncbi:ASPSCR1 family protein [Megaselia abdita]